MKKQVLFICNANVWRSQVAEFLFNKLFKNFRAISAGIGGSHEGETVAQAIEKIYGNREVIDSFKKSGADIFDNKCKIVTKNDVADSSVVFVMEKSQKIELERRFPEFSNKIFVLGEFAHLEDTEIPNAIGGDVAFHLKNYETIKTALEKIKKENLLK